MGANDNCVVMLSGGVDSTTALGMVIEDHDIIHTVGFDYGQKHLTELKAAATVAEHYDVPFKVIVMPSTFKGGGQSSLMDDVEMPHNTYKEIATDEGVSPTYVPFRNANLISQTTAFALTHNCGWVYTGVHAEDARHWAYPDCTAEFIGAMANAVHIGTYYKVRLVAPFQYASKADIIKRGLELNVPYHLTHSCYEGTSPACGQCPTCVERIGAFLIAGSEDPIEYKVDWKADIERYQLA